MKVFILHAEFFEKHAVILLITIIFLCSRKIEGIIQTPAFETLSYIRTPIYTEIDRPSRQDNLQIDRLTDIITALLYGSNEHASDDHR
jgi:hypothetical protein